MKPLALAALTLAAPACASSSDIGCGPIVGTIPVADDQVSLDLAGLSMEDARSAALLAVPGATITDIDLDEEDGFLVYEIELTHDRNEIDLVVDAGSGDVLCTDQD